MMTQRLASTFFLFLLVGTAKAAEPAWTTAAVEKRPMTADETRAFMKTLAKFVFDNHLKQSADSPQRGMIYEYFHVARKGEFDQFVQGEALDTMHDGAWFAVAMVNAHRATGDPFYKEFLTRWQLPFYLKMLNHSDELFNNKLNHARPERQALWKESKEWLLQPGENGFVPYFWDDGGSVSLEQRNDKKSQLAFPGFDQFAYTNTPNPRYLLNGYSLGSSNHMGQDLGVMLQQAWLLLKDSTDPADKKLAAELAEGAKHLHECRMRHHGHIPMSDAPHALASGDVNLMKHVPAADTPAVWTPAGHYITALRTYKLGQRTIIAGFADDQQYRYYAGIAKHGGQLPEALAFKTIYDAYTAPLLYRYYSDDADVPAGINRFDLHPYMIVDGKFVDYRSERKGPSGKPRPIGSRMGPQNMICCGLALQALKARPGIWEARYEREFPNDVRVYILDRPLSSEGQRLSPCPPVTMQFGPLALSMSSTRLAMKMLGTCTAAETTFRFYNLPDGEGTYASITLRRDRSITAVNDKGDPLNYQAEITPLDGGFTFRFDIPYTIVKTQPRWAQGVEHGRYSVAVGNERRNIYLASNETQVRLGLQHELAGGLRTWETIFREKGYIPTGIGAGGMGAGYSWEDYSDSGGYAHLISAAAQWLIYLDGRRDWEVHHVPALPAAAQ